jgi:predicted cobalt transporter CbtA
MATRTTLLSFGSLLAWLLYSKGQEVGWMGGVLWGLAGIAIGVVAIGATSVITAIKMKKKEEKTAVSLAFLAASAGLLVIGAARMIKW